MFQIDPGSQYPIYEQIINNVIKLASLGVIKPGDRLPPVRVLASQLGINPNTVAKAYRELEERGYLCSAVGRGSFLSDKASQSSAQKDMALKEFSVVCRKAVSIGATKDELIKELERVMIGGFDIDRDQKSDENF